VGLPAGLVLAKSGLKNLSWQGQEAERIELAELLQLAKVGAIATLPEHRTQPSGPQLHRRLQFGQRGDHNIALAGDCVANGFTFRFAQQQLQQAAAIEVNHVRLDRSGRSSRVAANVESTQRETRLPLTVRCHLPCATGSKRFRRFFGGVNLTSLATGLESRVMMISRSLRRSASAWGQRWRRSLTLKLFMRQD
jgi:hypothetical protein